MNISQREGVKIFNKDKKLYDEKFSQFMALGALMASLSACQTTNTEGLSQKAHDQAGKIDSQLQQSGAVIVTRVTNRGDACPLAEVRLRPTRNGQIDTSVFYTVGQTRSVSGQSHLGAASSIMWRAATLQMSSVMEDIFPKDGSTSFVGIPPGNYFVTSVTCDYGNGRLTRLGADHPNLLSSETGAIAPVQGGNFIQIRRGDILDAGILDIIETGSTPGLLVDGKTGATVAKATPPSYRQILQKELPDLYRRMRFATFTAKGN